MLPARTTVGSLPKIVCVSLVYSLCNPTAAAPLCADNSPVQATYDTRIPRSFRRGLVKSLVENSVATPHSEFLSGPMIFKMVLLLLAEDLFRLLFFCVLLSFFKVVGLLQLLF